MTTAVVSDGCEIRELTVEELDEAGGGLPMAWKIAGSFVLTPLGTLVFLAAVGAASLM